MSVRVVVGAQWGDEGKGKVVDLLSQKARYVVRYQGGANAGHTLQYGGTTTVLHLIPSGIFNPEARCVIGNGVVIDPSALLEELDGLKELKLDIEERLFISEAAHVILPYHKVLDQAREKNRGDQAIGTTGRGIGPAYISKVARTGIRIADLRDEDTLRQKLSYNLEEVNDTLKYILDADTLDEQPIVDEMLKAAERLRPYIKNSTALLSEAVRDNEEILLEGAQGSLLDVDHGTYPYVTSSSPTSGGACTGSGIPPTAIDHVMGISKAYCTRVGNGPFPTELHDEVGERLRKAGHEFGATTGRPRRCGWVDLVALKYAVDINGINELAITKLDVLDGFDEIKACTEYDIDGERTQTYPTHLGDVEKVDPIYQTFPGWESEIRSCESYDELPGEAKSYLDFLQEYLGVEISILSTGPDRDETLLMPSFSF